MTDDWKTLVISIGGSCDPVNRRVVQYLRSPWPVFHNQHLRTVKYPEELMRNSSAARYKAVLRSITEQQGNRQHSKVAGSAAK